MILKYLLLTVCETKDNHISQISGFDNSRKMDEGAIFAKVFYVEKNLE